MKISNQSLAVLLVTVLALVGIAVWLVLRPPPPPPTASVMPEEKIVDQPPIVRRRSSSSFAPEGPVLVHADEGRVVVLQCDGMSMQREIIDGVATFESVPTKTGCTVDFLVPESADHFAPFEPVLPGDDITCRAEDKEIVCDGSLAEIHAGTIMAWSPGEGEVTIDGELIGPVPINNHRLPVGKHKLEFHGKRARSSSTLSVRPDEQIEIMFSSPARDAQDAPPMPVPEEGAAPEEGAPPEEGAAPADTPAPAEGSVDNPPEAPAGTGAAPGAPAPTAPPPPVDQVPE